MEYVDLQLCRLYGCAPSVLDEQATDRMLDHLLMVGLESEIARKRAK